MIEFEIYLYDVDSGVGRGIYKICQWPVLPRIGEEINFFKEGATVEVTDIWHNFDMNETPTIEVKCENILIHHLRNLYKDGKNGWELYDTNEEALFDDSYGVDSGDGVEIEPQSDPREPPLVTQRMTLQ